MASLCLQEKRQARYLRRPRCPIRMVVYNLDIASSNRGNLRPQPEHNWEDFCNFFMLIYISFQRSHYCTWKSDFAFLSWCVLYNAAEARQSRKTDLDIRYISGLVLSLYIEGRFCPSRPAIFYNNIITSFGSTGSISFYSKYIQAVLSWLFPEFTR